MNTLIRSFACVLMVLLLAGCKRDLPTEPGTVLSLAPDKAVYAVGDSIAVTLRNGASSPLYVASCCSSPVCIVQGSTGSQWADSLTLGEPCLMMCPTALIILKPSTATGTFFRLPSPGTYRVKMFVGWSMESVHSDSVISRSFTVH